MHRSGLARKVEESESRVERAYEAWTRSAGDARAAAFLAVRDAERARDEALRALLRSITVRPQLRR